MEQINGGDREAFSAVLLERVELIRATVRRRMGAGVRDFFDSDDVLSTILHRLDRYVAEGKADLATERQLWKLIETVSERQIRSKARVAARLRRSMYGERAEGFESGEGAGASEPGPDNGMFDAAMRSLHTDLERRILWMRIVAGLEHKEIATILGITPAAAKQRWHALSAKLRESLEEFA